ncbi:hypothetical protein FGB62_322g017 [Gracilaria domingensis]|nr:hypothetical protein FGB62_322g017 [Gracilaria domingensis]
MRSLFARPRPPSPALARPRPPSPALARPRPPSPALRRPPRPHPPPAFLTALFPPTHHERRTGQAADPADGLLHPPGGQRQGQRNQSQGRGGLQHPQALGRRGRPREDPRRVREEGQANRREPKDCQVHRAKRRPFGRAQSA